MLEPQPTLAPRDGWSGSALSLRNHDRSRSPVRADWVTDVHRLDRLPAATRPVRLSVVVSASDALRWA